MKKKIWIFSIAGILLLIAGIGIALGLHREPEGEVTDGKVTQTPTLTQAPTSTPALTPTQTLTPTPALPTVPAAAPTDPPVTGEEPSPTEEPVTPTEAPTETPEPTKAPAVPTPTPYVAEAGVTLLWSAQRGDNVTYELYDDYTLVIKGTGATWDFASYLNWRGKGALAEGMAPNICENYLIDVTTIVIEEGITSLGTYSVGGFPLAEKIILPSTLKKVGDCAFMATGRSAAMAGRVTATEWIGLDLSKLEIGDCAFERCTGLDAYELEERLTVSPTPTPSPTPSPTPLPPDPETPKLAATIQYGADIIEEVWDNGDVYLTGSGATGYASLVNSTIKLIKKDYSVTYPKTLRNAYIGEGITEIAAGAMPDAEHLYLPSTLRAISTSGLWFSAGTIQVTASSPDGGQVTFEVSSYYNDSEVWESSLPWITFR